MKLTFKYNQDKDIWCLLNKGKSSINSPYPTKVYKELEKEFGENPSEKDIKLFVEKYISNNNLNIKDFVEKYQKDWDSISGEYQKIAEKIFKASLPKDIIAYLTINNRCPYNIKDNFFFVSIPDELHLRKIVMHELWHFYTWYKFGYIWESKIGKEKYNELKESLTVLLNIECKNLLSESIIDKGYPQHKELREKILKLWEKTKDIDKVWDSLI
ncbi:MAG: hypothetical protein WCW04_01650 [Candidatus Paceibacterota bacterium]